MAKKFLTLNQIISRDIDSPNLKNYYQVQATLNQSSISIKHVGRGEQIPLIPILTLNHQQYECMMLSYCLSEEELTQPKLRMIGFIIQKADKVIASLDLMFVPQTTTNNISDGWFEVILSDAYGCEQIKLINKYIGNDESIYLLTNLLLETNIDECKDSEETY